MVTKAKRAANDRWDKDNMVILSCKVKKTDADRYKAAAAEKGMAINAYISQALDAFTPKTDDHEKN